MLINKQFIMVKKNNNSKTYCCNCKRTYGSILTLNRHKCSNKYRKLTPTRRCVKKNNTAQSLHH